MTPHKTHRRLSIPRGTERLQLEEAAHHRTILRRLEDVFASWGYAPAETPMVDYFDVYSRLLSEDAVRRTYRALDRHGELLLLRSDTTLFLAKQLGIHLRPEELPIRVYYNAQILRHEGEHDIAHNEYHQSGVELVGVAGVDGDVETLVLLHEALHGLGLTDARIHLGTHGVVDAIVQSTGIADGAAFERSVRLRNRAEIEQALASASDADPETIRSLLLTIRQADDFLNWWDAGGRESCSAAAPAVLEALDGFCGLIRFISESIPPEQVRVDLSELGTQEYYTGVAFAVYAKDVDSAIARGGRYDRLLQSFGIDAPSVGFSMYTRKIPCRKEAINGLEGNGITGTARGASLHDRLKDARRRRAAGERVHL